MTAPQRGIAKLADKIILNEKFIQLKFEWVEPHRIEFTAGQYISLAFPDKPDRRPYSICSVPSDDHGFDLLVDLAPNGIGVQYLNGLQFGQQITCLSPLGVFTVPPVADQMPLHFIATASGIAPFRSMILHELQEKKNTQPIHLYWGVREATHFFWLDEFEELMDGFPQFKFHPVVSRPPDDWPLCNGRVTDCLTVHPLLPNAHYFICGSKQMVADVEALLQQKGVAKANLHREKFY